MRALDRDDPREIGGYRLLRVLGAGGMGRVYLARSPGGRTVAVKVIRPELSDDVGFRNLFRREVAAARRVGGAWTAPVIDADTEASRPWLVTGYVAGPSVYEAVERHGPLPESSVRTLGAGLAEALIAIHGTGLIHRDLKPTNVLLSLDGPRVIDFGISRALDASVHTRTGATVGSPGFMSPEQIDGRDVGPATDVFSLGSVLVFAATAEGPFGAGSGQALMFRIVSKSPELGAVPPALRDLISACLAKFAGNRPSPQELLAHFAPGGSTAALVAPGWLPGPLTTDLSRRAIALLEIDELAGDDIAPPEDWTSADHWPSLKTAPTQPPSRYDETQPPSQHGPRTPPPMPRVAPQVAPQTGAVPRMPSAAPRPAAPAFPPAAPAPAAPPQPPGGPAPSRESATAPVPVFASAPAAPPPSGARYDQYPAPEPFPARAKGERRGTPWLYLSAIAGAIAIISTSALIARSDAADKDTPKAPSAPADTRSPQATPQSPAGSGSGGTASSPGTAGPTGGTAPGPSTGNAAAKIPDGYLGKWTGTIISQGSRQSTFTITMHQANDKGVVAESSADIPELESDCTSNSRLISVDNGVVKLQDVPDGRPQPSLLGMPACSNGGQITLKLDPAGNTVHCVITSTGSGNPEGTLRRT
ncbi:protein kinase domain-containing protein [Streptodolium elevatio]|uniref:Protein kinase n=1 Tax=Streptodolium elevatio TaxID=3157996 RepID=A0ABV3DSS6_9ACTN